MYAQIRGKAYFQRRHCLSLSPPLRVRTASRVVVAIVLVVFFVVVVAAADDAVLYLKTRTYAHANSHADANPKRHAAPRTHARTSAPARAKKKKTGTNEPPLFFYGEDVAAFAHPQLLAGAEALAPPRRPPRGSASPGRDLFHRPHRRRLAPRPARRASHDEVGEGGRRAVGQEGAASLWRPAGRELRVPGPGILNGGAKHSRSLG